MTTTANPRQITIGGDLTVNRVGYGAMKLTGDQVWGPYPDHDHAVRVLRGVVDAGINLIDTADVYGPHENELLIKDALHPYPEGLVIATKGGFVRGGFDYGTLDAVGNPNYLRQSARMSARRLGLDVIDLYYLHSGRALDAPFEDQVGVLAELRQAGLIRHVGLSNVTLEQLRTAQSIVPVAAVTALYNVTARAGADLLAAAEARPDRFLPVASGDDHGRAARPAGRRGAAADRGRARRHRPADRAGMAASGVAAIPADPGDDLARAPAREPPGAVDHAQPAGDAGHR